MPEKNQEENIIRIPRPTSELIWKTILTNSEDAGGVCIVLNRFQKSKSEELNGILKSKDWKTASNILNELKTAERFEKICQKFPKL